jgi:uncharacterized SAM-binding protein YcdF (DUF218 family)
VYVYLSKILPLFVMPIGVTLFFALVALFLLRKGKPNFASAFVVLAFVYLWVMSTPIVGKNLYQRIESNYPAVPVSQVPEAGCMIVLGGVMGDAAPPRVDVEMYESIDRVYKTAELFNAGKAPYVIVTGGNQPWSRSREAEADLIKGLLVEWGVPEDAILLEGSSRNTRENAMFTKNLVDSIHCDDSLLITSAAHMPRAMAAFQVAGVSVTPVSTDVRVADSGHTTIMDFLPDAHALKMSSDAIRELIGQWVYEMREWN